jgi:hypothetical protein
MTDLRKAFPALSAGCILGFIVGITVGYAACRISFSNKALGGSIYEMSIIPSNEIRLPETSPGIGR